MRTYSKQTRGLMPAKLYSYSSRSDITISVYQGGDSVDIYDGEVTGNAECEPVEFFAAILVALEQEHQNNYVQEEEDQDEEKYYSPDEIAQENGFSSFASSYNQ